MKWNELIERVAKESGVPVSTTRKVLRGLGAVTLSALAANEEVPLSRIGVLSTRVLKGRTIRSVANNRKMLVGERYAVKFRASAAARRAVADLIPALWKTSEHQSAWRLAETLIADLNLYHAKSAPADLSADLSDDALIATCKSAFGPLWRDVDRAYNDGVPEEVRNAKNYLAGAARRTLAN